VVTPGDKSTEYREAHFKSTTVINKHYREGIFNHENMQFLKVYSVFGFHTQITFGDVRVLFQSVQVSIYFIEIAKNTPQKFYIQVVKENTSALFFILRTKLPVSHHS
jgi:hypothetical protein